MPSAPYQPDLRYWNQDQDRRERCETAQELGRRLLQEREEEARQEGGGRHLQHEERNLQSKRTAQSRPETRRQTGQYSRHIYKLFNLNYKCLFAVMINLRTP